MKLALPPSSAARKIRPGSWYLLLAALLAVGSLSGPRASAADGPPPLMSFQTRILDSSGVAVPNATKEVIFRIYAAEIGGASSLWSEKQTVATKDGYISVILGQGGPVPSEPNPAIDSLFGGTGDTERYIEVQYDGTKISPRLRLLPSAYSFVSGVALRLVSNSITTAMLRDNSVGNAAIGANAVTTGKIADGSVTTAKIADANVTTAKIADLSITTAKVANNAITAAQIADGAIGSSEITDGSVATADIANGAVTLDKLAANAVNASKIVDGSIGTADLADSSVTGAKIANSTIGSGKIGQIFSTASYNPSSGTTLTWVPVSDWYPVVSSSHFGTSDLNEGGTGDLGGPRVYAASGYWWVRSTIRWHITVPTDSWIRILWIPRSMVAGNLVERGGWQE